MAIPRAIETEKLIQRLERNARHGDYDVIEYGELSRLIGRDVQQDGRAYLSSARRCVEREETCLFGVVTGVGIKLMTPKEQSNLSDDTIARLRRFGTRSTRRLERVDYDKFDEFAKTRHNTAAAIMGVIHLATKKKSIEKLADASSGGKIRIGETLRLFSNGPQEG